MKNSNLKLNRFVQVAYPLLAYYLLYNMLSSGFRYFLKDRVSPLFCLAMAALVTTIFLYLIYRTLPIVKPVHQFHRGDFIKDISCIFLIIAVGVVLNLLVSKMGALQDQAYIEANAVLYSGTVYTKILANAILIPVLEELVFRGILCSQLSLWHGSFWGVMISSLIFGAMHFNVVQFLYAVLVGAVIGICYNSSKKLWVVMLGHGLTNLIVILFTL